ncbi:lasso peptide biosynthesis PqqD family chaperone [Paenibacillus sacheonensis]|uniref:Lasso peptide biosynthesis PqqD family chaperone n=2 Tax=Paenibacillus sacheonensis TaxID=742054 RepID=A0A7X5C137_9BACL|nr:lasso peptide biosynthesis PqqD family chaperone [Paenibacillus sacheonensis]
MDGDIVMMNIQQGKYYNLGQVGGVIWDLLQNPSTVEELTDALLNEFEITPEECESQVIAFLEQLMKEQLIQSA